MRLLIGTIVLYLVALGAWTQEKGPEKQPESTTAKKRYDKLAKEYERGTSDFQKAYQAAKTDEERKKAFAKFPNREEYGRQMLKLALDNAGDTVAVDALVWVVVNAGYVPEGNQALAILTEKHLRSDKLGALYLSLVYAQSANAEKLLRGIIRENPNREVRGKACFSLARRLSEQADANQDKEADRLFEEVEKKYADIDYFRQGMTLGVVATQARKLLIGKQAPEIDGEDIDGKRFKLSDYRGKVVVIDFWGHW
jgi:hypothetical protein